jgi:hypothetical protein
MTSRGEKPERCDCLNWCGDDPWLKDGRAEGCERYKARIAVKALDLDARIDALARREGLTREAFLARAIKPYE